MLWVIMIQFVRKSICDSPLRFRFHTFEPNIIASVNLAGFDLTYFCFI